MLDANDSKTSGRFAVSSRTCAVSVVGTAAGLAVLAGVAGGASFGVNTVDAGGVAGGALGNPITWTGGSAFNPGTGSDFPPSVEGILAVANLRFDSYVAIDPVGPTSSTLNPATGLEGYQCLGPSNIIRPTAPTTIFQADRLTGIWFNAGANGGFVTSGAGDRIFIAQVTLRAGSSDPTTAGVLVNIRDAGTANIDGELGALRFGAANATNNGGKWGQSYYLDFVTRLTAPIVNPVVGATSYAIYVVAVPGPGAAGVIAAAGLVAVKRRRV